MGKDSSLNIRGEEPGVMEPKFLYDWTATVPEDADAEATIKWVGKDGPDWCTLPAWLLKRIRDTGGNQ